MAVPQPQFVWPGGRRQRRARIGFSVSRHGESTGGRADGPLCRIEVKASSGDGSESFPMTANEWDKARECHQMDESVYSFATASDRWP
ncbi:MAG: DUF3883 domain-containing protein [Rhodocyclaceae bacterium]|nr:MAG: DUF3883 domain-containing protein [Rhodocyclaceae bacterium]